MACLKCANGDLEALERARSALGAVYRGCDMLGYKR
jgi:hypothetical protein